MGEKTLTVRRSRTLHLRPGELVGATVGPRKPFAHLRIQAVESDLSVLSAQHAADVMRIYGTTDGMSVIRYRVEALP